MSDNKPKGLIRRDRVVPKKSEDLSGVSSSTNNKTTTRKFDNQKSNLKVSSQIKQEIDILIKLTHNKFTYEMIEEMIDSYVNNELTEDQQRAFKSLSKLID
ncbi:hypothetical protein GSH19_04935 [Lactobacillus sp. S2-2]|uniref:hypothetical protein n=1 Tax=Lactobacillus sp. S2-2 TaxID=2692917 RepID=UPI001F261418|nr:hypothetical protein [Lactobacillus sp. S2-2]MCF6515496.1 hypothetical protein [Lactobacillus sp. S2-2]